MKKTMEKIYMAEKIIYEPDDYGRVTEMSRRVIGAASSPEKLRALILKIIEGEGFTMVEKTVSGVGLVAFWEEFSDEGYSKYYAVREVDFLG